MAASATPGPWRSFVEGRDHTSGSHYIATHATDSGSNASGPNIELHGGSAADHDFVAEARNWVPLAVEALLEAHPGTRASTPSLAPEPVLKAALAVLFWAAVYTRNWALHEDMDRLRVRDLWEAIHPIPVVLTSWRPDAEEELLMYFDEYASKWSEPNLRARYEQVRDEETAEQPTERSGAGPPQI